MRIIICGESSSQDLTSTKKTYAHKFIWNAAYTICKSHVSSM